MIKKIVFVLVGLVLVFATLSSIKFFQIRAMIEAGESFKVPPATVTARDVTSEVWENTTSTVGSFEAVKGVAVSATLSGQVEKILFESGVDVEKNQVLVQQDISAELAQLREAQASAKVAQLSLERQQALLKTKAISRSSFDSAEAELNGAKARVDSINAIIEKMTIRAPFSGRLGISQINVGQNLQAGESIVTLQSMDPIFINFSLPQTQLADIQKGLVVRARIAGGDKDSQKILSGVITAINPQADSATRNVQIQAQVGNPQQDILPGMFADVSIIKTESYAVLPAPATAIQYAPYGDSVFVIESRDGSLFLRQQVVRLGATKGDFVEVLSGLKAGEKIVTMGGFKLHNGQEVVIDNTLSPEFSLNPQPSEG